MCIVCRKLNLLFCLALPDLILVNVLSAVSVDVSDAGKKRDIILSVYVANHTTIRAVDHLSEVIDKHCMQSGKNEERTSKPQLALHRTKCSAVIMNVILPGILEHLKEEIGESYFSVTLDESTDVATVKLMAYMIRYYNRNLRKIVTDFLGVQILFRTTAADVLKYFESFTSEFQLDLSKMIAIGTDGASTLCSCNNSLYTLLKKKYPKLILMKCTCHSLSKCSEKACQELPAHLEFLLRETRFWFCHSALQKQIYSNLYKSILGKEAPKLSTR